MHQNARVFSNSHIIYASIYLCNTIHTINYQLSKFTTLNIQFRGEDVRTTNEKLVDAFKKHRTVDGFLLECGQSEENRDLFEQLSLLESFDEDQVITFSNGMFVPGLGSRAKGRLSLNEIANRSLDANDFVSRVNESLAPMLEIELTESDKELLVDQYQKRSVNLY